MLGYRQSVRDRANMGDAPREAVPGSDIKARWIGLSLFAVVACALAWRITVGIDLSDESYYAIFVDDWLKGSIASSPLLPLHQTAALIVYPFARLYAALRGSETGLFLFLRALYLVGAVLAACVLAAFLRRGAEQGQAWLAAAAFLAFVPFGLPAPSYNTLGEQGLMIALAGIGCAAGATTGISRRVWCITSALGWAVATVAYPPLVVVLAFFAGAMMLRLGGSSAGWVRQYLGLCLVAQVLGWVLVVSALGSRKLSDGYIYLQATNDVGGLGRKLGFALETLASHLGFSMACLVAIAIGLLRWRLGPLGSSASLVLLLGFSLAGPPALFLRAHDQITLLALSGLGLLAGFARRATSDAARLRAVLYATSMAAGSVIAVVATNSIFNFCVGAAPAAILALAVPAHQARLTHVVAKAPYAAALVAFLLTSMTFFYGDLPRATGRERIGWGVFAGLAVQPEQAALLRIMRDEVDPRVGADRTIAAIGRLPGVILATRARPLMPSVYSLSSISTADGVRSTEAFYRQHRASIVTVYRDPYLELANPLGTDFVTAYEPVAAFAVPPGTLDVYRRR